MTLEIGLIFAILLGTLIIFALDRHPVDFVAFALMGLMLVLGPIFNLKPEEAISGFSNPATITVMAMFVLSGGIYRTGLINLLAKEMVRLAGASERRQLSLIMLVVGPISAFVNNTAAVAILIPSVISMARDHRRAPSRLLMPLSFFSQLAGVTTLIGTSTNILASELAAQEGVGPFSLFEFSTIGLLIFMTGAVYLLLVAPRLLPERRIATEVSSEYQVKAYLSEVVVLQDSALIGQAVDSHVLRQRYDIYIVEILRHGQKLARPLRDYQFQADDILFVQANPEQLLKFRERAGVEIEPELRLNHTKELQQRMIEVIISPTSELIGETLQSSNFRYHYSSVVIAMRHQGDLLRERLGKVPLALGDTLLLWGPNLAIERIKQDPGFIVTEEVQLDLFRTERSAAALAIIAGVVMGALLGLPILVTAIAGCVLMVLSGCLTMNELHESIRWDVIFLLAGVIPLGLALERSGGAQLLADLAAHSALYVPPLVVLGIFYLLAMVMTGLISNNATVVVMVPVGVATAQTLGLDAKAFILAIMFAASTSFFTPIGYQTNTMIYGPGGYKFLDFTKVGLPLNLLLAVATPLYIYWFWGV